MTRLGDYLGNLLSEVTMARVHADLEAVRVAEMYSSHPLLKHMPVPRFRLPSVELDVPISISGMEKIDTGDEDRVHGLDPKELGEMFVQLTDTVLNEHHADLTEDEVKERARTLSQLIEKALTQPFESRSLTGIVSDLVDEALKPLANPARTGGAVTGRKLEKVRAELKSRAMVEFLKLQADPPRLEAEVMTHKVKEESPAVLARIKMRVSEEGMEWSEVENDEGRVERRLLAE